MVEVKSVAQTSVVAVAADKALFCKWAEYDMYNKYVKIFMNAQCGTLLTLNFHERQNW